MPFPFQSCVSFNFLLFFGHAFIFHRHLTLSNSLQHRSLKGPYTTCESHEVHLKGEMKEMDGHSSQRPNEHYIHSWPVVPGKQESSLTLHCFLAHFDHKGQSLYFSLWHILTTTENHFKITSVGMQNGVTVYQTRPNREPVLMSKL